MNDIITVPGVVARKGGDRLAMLTAYDYCVAGIADAGGVDMVLVGDSLAMVGLGQRDTLAVGMDAMVHHTRAVSRAVKHALVVGDMPFMSYQSSPQKAVENAGRFLAEGRAGAVKVEGGARMLPAVEAIIRADIPVMGHIGLTPQSLAALGGFKAQAKTAHAAELLVEDAIKLEQAGCFSIVLEAVPAPIAKMVTDAVGVPTIGIGAGPHCDGQVLVTHDLLGLFDRFTPKFVKQYAQLGKTAVSAVESYVSEVRQGAFPAQEHSFTMPAEELAKLQKG